MFNYAKEWKKFMMKWRKKEQEYRAAGMSEEQIQEMYEFELKLFHQKRVFESRNESSEELSEKGNSIYLDAIRVEETDYNSETRNSWLEEIEDRKLFEAINMLKEEDVEMLTLWVFEGYNMTEIAHMKQVTQPAISKRLSRIKKFLKKNMMLL